MGSKDLRQAHVFLQERDISLLIGLVDSRQMTLRQMASLFFAGRREYAKKRLQRLQAARLILQKRGGRNVPALTCIAPQAVRLLKSANAQRRFGIVQWQLRSNVGGLSSPTLKHDLQVIDVVAAICEHIPQACGLRTPTFTVCPDRCQFQVGSSYFGGTGRIIKPDGFVRIEQEKVGAGTAIHDYFLELDRSTETDDTVVSKLLGYLEYYRSGGFAVRNGVPREEFRRHPFRVLVVLKSNERLNNIAERLLLAVPPVLNLAWLTTVQEVLANPFAPIWVRPSDYRSATHGSPFQPQPWNPRFGYRRNRARDDFVQSRLRKLPLFTEDTYRSASSTNEMKSSS